ncbi:hypothetical protein ACN47E_001823 [Coniothyrium glycines]
MARRSARLQKHSAPPARSPRDSADSWQTASSPAMELPSLPELPDPNIETPRKPACEARQPMSKLPQATPTGHKSNSTKLLLAAAASRTPQNRTPIKPAGEEMHPALHHASTAKPLDEARWLGFQAIGAHTAPPKASGLAGQSTPSKTPVPTSETKFINMESSPNFQFRFKSPFSMLKGTKQDEAGLSPGSRSLLRGAAISGTPGAGSRALFGTTGFSTKADMSPERKKAEAKGKRARFSDVHMQQFKKMDSIANHPSAFRADPTRFKPVAGPALKQAPSQTEVAKPEPNKLKRTQSKAELVDSSTKPTTSLKRTQSKMDMAEAAGSKIPPTPLKRTQSKMDLTGSSLPRSHSTVRLVPPTRDGRPLSGEGATDVSAKRIKRTEADDAATTRPKSHDGKTIPTMTASLPPARKITSQTALPRLAASAARLMTPTKSSIARAQSAKVNKSSSMIPSLLSSPSTNELLQSPSTSRRPMKTTSSSNLFSPGNHLQAMRDGARESMRKASQNLQRVRSILRTPSRKFSDDPAKIAAGTHMSPPPIANFEKALPAVPATAPVKKHVNFTNSTLERANFEAIGKSPSPMKLRAGSEVPTGAVIYPSLGGGIQYPEVKQDVDTLVPSPSRRLTFGAESARPSSDFSFSSGKPVNFGPASAGTIRMVRKSDASAVTGSNKRKLDTVQETSDKENDGPGEDDLRSAKKVKHTPSILPKTPASASKHAQRTPARSSGISKSRLAFLATPKRTRA